MTRAKKLKTEIRSRARKTGESYTSARRRVLHARQGRTPARPAVKPSPRANAPVSDAGVIKKTGKGFDHWFGVLDAFGSDKGHTAFARHLHAEHGVPGWHAQMITVAYERVRGLRAVNQACTGRYQVSVSRAVPVSVAEAVDALRDPSRRARWLARASPELRLALQAAFEGPRPRRVVVKDAQNARLRFKWDGATVEIRIAGKMGGASVVADNQDLSEPALVEARRAQWATALDALRAHLRS